MRVRNDFIAIRKEEEELTTKTGIIMSVDEGQESYNLAVIVGVGDKVEDLNVGDRIYVSQYTGTRVEIPNGDGTDENIFFMKEEDVFAVIEEAQ